jgi:lysophospholipid acyltransferase (LPLAT)-like uncharacterized protein
MSRIAPWVFHLSWDRQRAPLPFSTISMEFAEPLRAAELGLEQARHRLAERL